VIENQLFRANSHIEFLKAISVVLGIIIAIMAVSIIAIRITSPGTIVIENNVAAV
jgi:hypothetical protein